MRVRYRRAVHSDIPAIIRVQRCDGFAHQYYLTEERVRRLMDREHFFVAHADRYVIGFGSVDCDVRAAAHFVCVDAAYGRRGIGRALMFLCIREARKAGCARIHSFVEEHSMKETFLKSLGFDPVGIYRNRYGNGINATIWERGVFGVDSERKGRKLRCDADDTR